MSVKYIQKNNKGLWAISNSKTGRALRTTNTQKEAIAIAGSQKTTEGIMIKRSSGWGPATGWDQKIANSTKSATTIKKAKDATVTKKPETKKSTIKKVPVKKSAAKKPAAKKAPVKKVSVKKVAVVPVTKAPEKKLIVAKTSSKKAKKVTKKPTKCINGYWGLLIGFLIIAIVIGGAFLLGHYL